MTQQERQQRSREEIFRAAQEEFGTVGYDGVNMERICAKHGISKGMMYHYYTGKDELFLLCVERTFRELEAYIEGEMESLEKLDVREAVKSFFVLRERFFEQRPLQKGIFESAMLRPPKHLVGQIEALRVPVRRLNRAFIAGLTARMPLRQGLDPEAAARYLESVEPYFQNILNDYCSDCPAQDVRSMLSTAGGLLDLILFGLFRRPDGEPAAAVRGL